MFNEFDPDMTALVLIDVQVGNLRLLQDAASNPALSNAVKLAEAAKILDLPVVMTSSQEEQVQGRVAPELQRALPEAFACRIRRTGAVNAWTDPDFRAAIQETGRTQLLIAGVTADAGLVLTSIGAVRDGFEVQAVLDASGSAPETSEYTSRRRMEYEGVELTTTNAIIAELAQDWSTPQGAELAKLTFAQAKPPGVFGRFGT